MNFQNYIIEKWRKSDESEDVPEILTDYMWNSGYMGTSLTFVLKEKKSNDTCRGIAIWTSAGELQGVAFETNPTWAKDLDYELVEVLNIWTQGLVVLRMESIERRCKLGGQMKTRPIEQLADWAEVTAARFGLQNPVLSHHLKRQGKL